MLRARNLLIIITFAIVFCSRVALAGFSSVGPINPTSTNGFPQWYKDANGVIVDLPIPPLGDGLAITPPTMIFAPLTAGSNAVAQAAGFDTEAFYFNATSPKTFQTKWGKVVVLFGLEASYVNNTPVAGDQMVFSRIRITAPNVQVAGTYKLFHPWGVETINVTTADLSQNKGKGIKFTKDFGLAAGWIANGTGGFTPVASPGGFYTVLQTGNTMSTVLRAVNPLPPPQWIGDGVTPATFTGSPIAYNKIRLEAPIGTDLDGKGNNFIESTQMIISGHIPLTTTIPLPLSLDRATCSHIGARESIDVWLTTQVGASVEIRDAAAGPNSFPIYTGFVSNPGGKFYASFFPPVPAPDAVIVTVTDSTGTFGPVSKTVNIVDYVNITTAAYSLAGKTLTIQATSSDWYKHPTTPPVLTAVGFGTLTFNNQGVASLTVTVTGILPPAITVNSQLNHGTAAAPLLVPGGSDTAQTGIVP